VHAVSVQLILWNHSPNVLHRNQLFFFLNQIPLATKLKECGVFGISGDEFLNYAIDNRREWEAKGEMIVEELVASNEVAQSEAPNPTCQVEL
jgi:hypothetical protein